MAVTRHVYESTASPANTAEPEASRDDLIEKWIRRAIVELQSGEREFAEDLMVDVLYLMGRGRDPV